MSQDIGKSIVESIITGALSQLALLCKVFGPYVLAAIITGLIWFFIKHCVRICSLVSGDSRRATRRAERNAKTWFDALNVVGNLFKPHK